MKISFDGNVENVLGEIKEFMTMLGDTSHINVPVEDPGYTKAVEDLKVAAIEKEEFDRNLEDAISKKEPVKKDEAPTTVLPTLPTITTEYTITDVQNTAGQLIRDKGVKKENLRDLLEKYGVQAVTELKSEDYGAVMEDLKALGADV